MSTFETDTLPRITQGEYIELEAGCLRRRLAEGDLEAVATSAATLRNELHERCGRIARSQGYHRHWPFLDE